jgi:hypothetical protein
VENRQINPYKEFCMPSFNDTKNAWYGYVLLAVSIDPLVSPWLTLDEFL